MTKGAMGTAEPSKKPEVELRRAKAEAENERRRLNDLFMQAPAMISVVRGPKHVYEFANSMYLKVVGKTNKIIGKSVAEVFPELRGQGILEVLDQVYKTGKPYEGSEVLIKLDIHNNGVTEDFYFNFVYQPFRDVDNNVDGIMTHAINVTDQVLARKKIEKDREYFYRLLEKSSEVVALSDKEGNFIYASPGIKKVLGYTPKELFKTNGFQLVHPDDLGYIDEKFKKLLSRPGSSVTIELRCKHKNGSWRWIESIATNLLDDPRISAIVSNFRDIHDRKKAEADLDEIRIRLKSALAAGTIATWTWDIKNNNIFGDENMAKFFGVDKSKAAAGLSASAFIESIHPDDRPRIRKYVARVIKTREKYETEYRLVNKKGGMRWVLARGKVEYGKKSHPIRVVGVLMDITARKKAEDALKESEEQLRFMAETMPQKMFAATPEGNVDYFNPQWMEFTGLSFGQIRDWGWTQFIHPDDVEDNIARWQYSLETGEPFSLEHRIRRHDGQYRWHVSRAQAMRDDHGKIIRWFGSNTDIHNIKLALQREHELVERTAMLTEQRSQLIELNKAKDEFISLSSHQLRTPATGVKQFIGMLLDGYAGELTSEQKSFLELAHESNERQLHIIDDLLKVARVDAGNVSLKIEKVNLVSLINDVLDEQASLFIKRNQNIEFKHRGDDFNAYVDKSKIRMVLENIINNASKYTFANKKIQINLRKYKESFKITVQDEGVGIEKKDQEKLFEKFSRIDNPLSIKVGGTGLGLYWVKKIIDLHGGSIDVDSELNKGSKFTIKIPLRSKSKD